MDTREERRNSPRRSQDGTPSINDTPTNTRKKTGSALSINVIKTAARSGNKGARQFSID